MSTRSRLDTGQPTVVPGGRGSRGPIPFVRANALLPFCGFLNAVGAPVERMLGQARLTPALFDDPEALLPALSAYRFAELAALQERIEDLGIEIGRRTSPFELGAYGAALQQSATVYEYLKLGIGLIGEHSSGTRLWMTQEQGMLRVNQYLVGPPGTGRCIADVFTLVLTLNTLRQFLGPAWAPGEVRLLAGDEGLVGDRVIFGETRLIIGQRNTSFTIDRSLVRLPVSVLRSGLATEPPAGVSEARPMPPDFKASVEQLVSSLMTDGYLRIDTVAEAAGMSPRTLQRRLADDGLTYAGLVSASRLRLAREWLAESDLPVAEIATLLGYTEATNFARAFRRQVGMSPVAYRRKSATD